MKVALELADELRHLLEEKNKNKNLHCLEKDIGRNIDKVYSAEDSRELRRAIKKTSDNLENMYTLIKYIYQRHVAGNKNVECASGEVSEGNRGHVIGSCLGDFCYKVAENLVELCSSVGWQ